MPSSIREVSRALFDLPFRALTCGNCVSEERATAYIHAFDQWRASPWGLWCAFFRNAGLGVKDDATSPDDSVAVEKLGSKRLSHPPIMPTQPETMA